MMVRQEKKVNWKVKVTDANGITGETSRTLFVDTTKPQLSVSQFDDYVLSSNNVITTNIIPSITGKLIDQLSGEDTTRSQDDYGPKVASGPKQVVVKIEKQVGADYVLHTYYTVYVDKTYWFCDDTEITDNTKQKCNNTLSLTTVKKNH
ncbi:MAG: hypothetical protein AAB546_04175 [Patescibacteria group bacterium]